MVNKYFINNVKINIFFASIIIILIIVVAFPVKTAEKNFYSQLKQELKKGNQEIPITKLTNFDWDELYFIGSYGKFLDIEGDSCVADSEDGAWALAFTKNRQLVTCFRGKKLIFDRKLKHYSKYSRKCVFIINNKIFNIKETTNAIYK